MTIGRHKRKNSKHTCRWEGPVEEKAPPYNIMSTAKPRGEEDERKYTLQARTKPYYDYYLLKRFLLKLDIC